MFLKKFRLLLFLLSFFVCEAGPWKDSLNFHLGNKDFSYITMFHRGLSIAAQQYTETTKPISYVGSLPHGQQAQNVDYDNVGNCFYTNRQLHYERGLRPPVNSENVAYGSLQIIFDDFSAKFLHLTDTVGGRTPQQVRAFSSSAHNSHTNQEALERLYQKKSGNYPSKPINFDPDDILIYHPCAHSEDKIYYVLSREYKRCIDKAWQDKPMPASKIIAVVLHMYSWFDMCGSCSYALDWELKHSEGFGSKILQYCCERNRSVKALVHFSALVSSKQGFLVWGKERRTLPEPPPVLANPENYVDYYGIYRRHIDFERDLSAERKFAQAVVPPFLSPIVSNPLYEFAREGNSQNLYSVRSV